MSSRSRLPARIRKELKSTGLRWSVEQGHGHRKLMVEGVMISPIGQNPRDRGSAIDNTISNIRRFHKQWKEKTNDGSKRDVS